MTGPQSKTASGSAPACLPRRALLEALALGAILALGGYLRLARGAAAPGWFSDEGTHLAIAQQVLLGQDQYLAVRGPLLLFARLPGFEWLLATALAVAGAGPGGDPTRGLAALRALTGLLGTVTVGLVYGVGREIEREKAGVASAPAATLPLLAALVYALYPSAILYSRFGFSYNLLAPLGLGVFWAALRYARGRDRRWLLLAAGLAGLGPLVDLWAWVWALGLAGAVGAAQGRAPRRRALADLALAGLALGAPFALFALANLLRAPEAFWFDLRFVLARLSALTPGQQAQTLAENLSTLMAQDGWLAVGFLGVLALRPARAAGLAALFVFGPLVVLGRTTALYSLGYYYLIPLLPWVGVGALAWGQREKESGNRGRWGRWLVRGGVGVVLAATAWVTVGRAQGEWPTAIDPFLLNPDDARGAAAALAAQRRPDELVVASPALAWLLPGQAADFQMALAAAGQPTPHIPPGLPADRYAFDPRFSRARYVVVDNVWGNWAVFHAPGLGAVLAEIEAWPVLYRAGEITVYARP